VTLQHPSEEVIVPFDAPTRDRATLATHVRGTIILGSQRSLRARGLFDRYLANVPVAAQDELTSMTGTRWVPMDVCLAHYRACDALGLERAQIFEIGSEAGRFDIETVLSNVIKLTREVGVTPWTAFSNVNRLMPRTWQGSTCGVFKIGPKEGRIEWIGQPAASIPYFRHAFGGMIHGILTLFCRLGYVREIAPLCTATTLGYRVSWA
jgi:hypothetical protein